jgi:hypothetical protein
VREFAGWIIVTGGVLVLRQLQAEHRIPSDNYLLPFYILAILLAVVVRIILSGPATRFFKHTYAITGRRWRLGLYIAVVLVTAIIGGALGALGLWLFEQQQTKIEAERIQDAPGPTQPLQAGLGVLGIRPLKDDANHTLGFLVDVKNFNNTQAYRITPPGIVTTLDIPGRDVKNPMTFDVPVATIGPTQTFTLRLIPNVFPPKDYTDLIDGKLKANIGVAIFYTDEIADFILDYLSQPQLDKGNEATVFRNSASRLKDRLNLSAADIAAEVVKQLPKPATPPPQAPTIPAPRLEAKLRWPTRDEVLRLDVTNLGGGALFSVAISSNPRPAAGPSDDTVFQAKWEEVNTAEQRIGHLDTRTLLIGRPRNFGRSWEAFRIGAEPFTNSEPFMTLLLRFTADPDLEKPFRIRLMLYPGGRPPAMGVL